MSINSISIIPVAGAGELDKDFSCQKDPNSLSLPVRDRAGIVS
jgi:hypothetical protein